MVIYVGNLSFDTSQEDLLDRFEQYGPVTSINILKDEISGNPVGFAFIEMESHTAGLQAVAGLDRTKLRDRTILVCETSRRIERRHPTKGDPANKVERMAANSAPGQESA